MRNDQALCLFLAFGLVHEAFALFPLLLFKPLLIKLAVKAVIKIAAKHAIRKAARLAARKVIPAIKQGVSKVGSAVKQGVRKVIPAIKNGARKVLPAIKNAGRYVVRKTKEAGRYVLRKTKEGLRKVGRKIKEEVRNKKIPDAPDEDVMEFQEIDLCQPPHKIIRLVCEGLRPRWVMYNNECVMELSCDPGYSQSECMEYCYGEIYSTTPRELPPPAEIIEVVEKFDAALHEMNEVILLMESDKKTTETTEKLEPHVETTVDSSTSDAVEPESETTDSSPDPDSAQPVSARSMMRIKARVGNEKPEKVIQKNTGSNKNDSVVRFLQGIPKAAPDSRTIPKAATQAPVAVRSMMKINRRSGNPKPEKVTQKNIVNGKNNSVVSFLLRNSKVAANAPSIAIKARAGNEKLDKFIKRNSGNRKNISLVRKSQGNSIPKSVR